jgi:D-arabinose 1-dehydrogenase-like Zn-dependent alcohol dehydrogenase
VKAFILDRYGAADRVRAAEVPEPEVREDDVLVEVHAAGLNLLDSKIRNGEFKLFLRYRLPLILGHDVAGVVARVGSRVRRFKPGDDVYARPADGRIGAFAEFIAINEADVAIKPKALTMEEAASIPLVGLTAWQALIERANLKKGQKVLIHAGSGGVGTFAIQLAKHLNATVATTTSTANVDLVRRGSEQPRQGNARKVSARTQGWWTAHFYLRPTGCGVCANPRRVVGLENDHGRLELRDYHESQAQPSNILVSVYESERGAVDRDHGSHR